MAMLPGPYRIPAYRAVGHFRLTNKTPAATYRAPGRYEGTFVRERLIDAVADRLGLDRVDGAPAQPDHRAAEMPFSRPLNALGTEVVYDSGDYALLLDKALAQVGWEALQAELRRRRAAGELVGAGIAMFVEKGGLGPPDGTRITVDTTGAVELVTGGSSVGQGSPRRWRRSAPRRSASITAGCGSCSARPTASSTASARMPRALR